MFRLSARKIQAVNIVRVVRSTVDNSTGKNHPQATQGGASPGLFGDVRLGRVKSDPAPGGEPGSVADDHLGVPVGTHAHQGV